MAKIILPTDNEVTDIKDPQVKKGLKQYQSETFTSLIKQVQAEYALAWLHQNGRIQENLHRLKLYNNQRLDKDLVGEPLMFTIHQTVLASIYNDQLAVSFEAKEEGDAETAENLNSLATYDHTLMMKNIIDYEWDWDATFFGRGFVWNREFDRSDKFMCPIPEVVDPTTWLYDPIAVSVNGNNAHGLGSMRFGGREIGMTKWQMKDNGNFFDLTSLKKGNNIKSLLQQATQARNDALGLEALFGNDANSIPTNLYGNTEFNLLEWVTIWKGRKVLVVLGNNMTTIHRFTDLGKTSDIWQLHDRPLYPTAHTFQGISIPDLTEDKQRQKSVGLNLALKTMKANLYPGYIYNEKQIKNPTDLSNLHNSNKFVASKGDVDVSRAIQPITKATADSQLLNYLLTSLDSSGQKATATPELQQGQVSTQNRTASELNLVASKVDTRYSLSAKIFGWSEVAFWQTWYTLYKTHFKDKIDEKIVRINGAFGSEWRPLNKANIISRVDPDITVESVILSDAKNYKERVLLQGFGTLVFADPTSNKRYFLKKMARLNGLKKDEIERLFPPTIDELIAEDENKLINQGKVPPINANDNHVTHWEIHSKAEEGPAKFAHMMGHRKAMEIKRDQPGLFPQDPNQVAPGTPGSGGTPGIPGNLLGGSGGAPAANTQPSVSFQ